ncbi:GDSL-type esterase/lipase family protein [Amnibacterium sp. CER49]|uniref:SGNH/GDSL hydrolase family protein n=1 Tax=Amnibacterium sp. CER49 TaxID=3039161 RepID=UPI0024477002|nr:SGNH/GDSL hydrolase family protein [Amnibacterium sp. CER49]MDH2443753.1 GDSL-type esterase/lipase family protein [Amnibacterium sp. CER49]
MLRRVLAATSLLLLGGVLVAAPARAATAPLPGAMAAAGDSITRAFDVNGSHFLSDAPAESWSTGTDGTVQSEAQRLLAIDPALAGQVYNDAKTGANMSALDAQLATAASPAQHADYVTVLMGANDVCGKTVAGMTPTGTFRSEFATALADFTNARPNATVFVSSIPNVYTLWSLLHTNGSARFAWSIYGVCQNMLGSTVTEAQRQTVLAQLQADNDVLAQVCGANPQCRWDNYATYKVAFTTAQVSTVDYFHPSIAGQKLLAQVAWGAGPFAG